MDAADNVKREFIEEPTPLTRAELFEQLKQRIQEVKDEPPIQHNPDYVLEVRNLLK